MNRNSTRILVLLAVGLFAFIFFVERHTTDTQRNAELVNLLFPEFVPAETTGVDIHIGTNAPLKLERVDGAWRFRSPFSYAAQQVGPDRLLTALSELRRPTHLTAQEVLAQTNGLGAFGFTPPWASAVFHQAKRALELRFGSRTLLGNQVYLQVVGQDGLYAVDAEFLKNLPASVNAWRDAALLNLDGVPFDRLEVRPRTNGFEVTRNLTNQFWQMTRPLLTRADKAKLEYLLQQLRLTRVSQFVTDDPRADLEPYGLQPPERELVFGQGTNDLVVLQIGKSPANDTNFVFLRRLSNTNVVLAPRVAIDPWLASFRDFCDRRLMVFTQDAVARVEVRADEPFALDRGTNGVWRIVEPYSAPADSVLTLELLANLAEMEFLEFEREVVTDFTPYGLAPPRRQFLLKSAAVLPGGAATNILLAQLDLGNPSGHKVFARRSLENSVVTALDNGRLPRTASELRDRHIWDVSTNQIASITIRQGGQVRKLIRTGPSQWTHAPGSEGIINGYALEEASFRLGQLRAETWVAQGEDQLVRYGIPAADHQVTIDLLPTEKPQMLTVRFGRKAPSRRTYASVQFPGQPAPVIFECPSSIYEFVEGNLTAVRPPSASPTPP